MLNQLQPVVVNEPKGAVAAVKNLWRRSGGNVGIGSTPTCAAVAVGEVDYEIAAARYFLSSRFAAD